MASIFILDEKTGVINRAAAYSLPAKKALIAWIMQYIRNDFNTWNYPDHITGIRGVNGNYYFDDIHGGRVIAAYSNKGDN